MICKVQRGAMRVYKMAQYAGSVFCVNYWMPHQPANCILRVFQFYELKGRAWISKLCNVTYRSRVMALCSYRTAARSSWDLERHGSHAAPTCQEGKVRHSGPRTDEVLNRTRWFASLKQKLTQRITRAALRLQTCTPVVGRDWTK